MKPIFRRITFNIIWFASACQHNPLEPSDSLGFDGKVYVGDSKNNGVSRGHGEPNIYCTDPKFDHFVCMEADEFNALISKILKAGCANGPTSK